MTTTRYLHVTRFAIGPASQRAATLRNKGYRPWRAYLPVWIGPARRADKTNDRDGTIIGFYLRCWPFRRALIVTLADEGR